MPSRDKFAEFEAWCGKHLIDDETFQSGKAMQIFLDRLLKAFGHGAYSTKLVKYTKTTHHARSRSLPTAMSLIISSGWTTQTWNTYEPRIA